VTLRQPLVLAAIGLLVLALVLRLEHHRHGGVVADPVRTPGVLNPDVAQATTQLRRPGGLKREEAAELRQRDGAVTGDESRVGVERVERACQEPYLVLTHAPQELGRQLLLLEEIEHARGTIMAGRIIGRAREPSCTLAVRDRSRRLARGERVEFGEPSGDHRLQSAVTGDAQEAVAFAQLAILVAAADYERLRQPVSPEREWHDAERVIGVHQQLRAHAAARREHVGEVRHDVGVLVQYG